MCKFYLTAQSQYNQSKQELETRKESTSISSRLRNIISIFGPRNEISGEYASTRKRHNAKFADKQTY